jgi:hypothetical protein
MHANLRRVLVARRHGVRGPIRFRQRVTDRDKKAIVAVVVDAAIDSA